MEQKVIDMRGEASHVEANVNKLLTEGFQMAGVVGNLLLLIKNDEDEQGSDNTWDIKPFRGV
jgi:hypothetical protein